MTKPRIPETDHGIQGEFNVNLFDQFQRNMRDRGWIETKAILSAGIHNGQALEIGPGPGYLGLEWLKNTRGTYLTALEISSDMIAVGIRNAAQTGLTDRWEVVEGSGAAIPMDSGVLDAVFSAGSLHEWSRPADTFQEILRVLKPGGTLFISDLRRDMWRPIHWFLKIMCKPKEIRPGLETSISAAYTPDEISTLLAGTAIKDYTLNTSPIGITIIGKKSAEL